MTARELIPHLESLGIMLSLHENKIRVQSKAKILDEHKALIESNRGALLTYLSESESSQATVPKKDIFKEYKLPNGNVLSISKEEFAEVVELFRFLNAHSDRAGTGVSGKEKEPFEPEEKQTCSNSK